MSAPLQPLLHDQEVALAAPTQAWFASDGTMGHRTVQGIFVSDVRIVRALDYLSDGVAAEHIGTSRLGASATRITHLHRHLDAPGADPDVRSDCVRTASVGGLRDEYTVTSRLDHPLSVTITARLTPDLSSMDAVKAGLPPASAPNLQLTDEQATWSDQQVRVTLHAPGAVVGTDAAQLRLDWSAEVPAHSSVTVGWTVAAVDERAVVMGVEEAPEWADASVTAGDGRFARWIAASLDDLSALRLTTTHAPGEPFLAAGAPWFFTLFGRDSIWAARMMLPFGTDLAGSTLRTLAALQGDDRVADTAEQPGKIMHELRRAAVDLPGEGITLPPLYYGTVDATSLWVCLLHDAFTWGMPDAEVEALLPNLERALTWMRDFGDADGDGLLEYIDETGRGLANQGWKDSGDSVQWVDGTLAVGPIALVEVQAYAYEAAIGGAALLEHFGRDGSEWRDWAAALHERFHASFWLEDDRGPYLAIALDADKRPVDSVTSNPGHVLGTGLLSPTQARTVAARLVGDDLSSGFGLRTMSTTAGGYWPLSYHGGTVWAHDTAIAIAGLTREGCLDEADVLIGGLLAAAEGFGSRMPELHSGEPRSSSPVPVAYPAACRPQAWSAAASIVVLASALGLRPEEGGLTVAPRAVLGALEVSGLRFAGLETGIKIDSTGELVARW